MSIVDPSVKSTVCFPAHDGSQDLSFVVTWSRNGFWLPMGILAHIIRSLPQQCCNFEIDTYGEDRAGSGRTHLCEAILDAITRLQHLRLHLSMLYEALFSADSAAISESVSGNCVNAGPSLSGLRSTDEQELMGSRAAIQSFAEGQPWKEAANGLRLPAMLFAGDESACTAN
jgi:hypothetical protein